jgi:sugar phosphate isomerase/epimerase
MSTKQFEPKFMRVGVLTAALQELTPREVRDSDPDRAIEEWVEFAAELGADNIQLSAALHPTESDVPAEAMLDPVANTLDLRQAFDKSRARRVLSALETQRIGISDLGYFDNMLHDDPAIR